MTMMQKQRDRKSFLLRILHETDQAVPWKPDCVYAPPSLWDSRDALSEEKLPRVGTQLDSSKTDGLWGCVAHGSTDAVVLILKLQESQSATVYTTFST